MVVLEGGWKLKCESLASLGFVLHGLVEKVGDIMRVGSEPKSSGKNDIYMLPSIQFILILSHPHKVIRRKTILFVHVLVCL